MHGRPDVARVATLLGRVREQAVLAAFLDAMATGPASVELVVEPGLGGTSLLESLAAQAAARGTRACWIGPTAIEVLLENGGLRDLVLALGPDRAHRLPEPQRRALDAAIADATPEAGAALALHAAIHSLLEEAASDAPLLIVVDDAHWLDTSSAELLDYSLRRARGPIGIACARRPGEGSTIVPRCATSFTIRLGPLEDPAIRKLVNERSLEQLDRSVVEAIVTSAGGSPALAVELAVSTDPRAGASHEPTVAVDDGLGERLASLAPDVLQVLATAGASRRPTVTALRAAIPELDVDASLEAAEAAGLVALAGDALAFPDPRVRRAVSDLAGPAMRRTAHRALASIEADDAEVRARHLAMAAIGPDAVTLDAIDRAASAAARRGSPADAAALLELGLRVGGLDPTDHGIRRLDAAAHRLSAGDLRQASALLDAALADPSTTDALAMRAIRLRADIAQLDGDLFGAASDLEQVRAAASDPADRMDASLALAFLLTNTGRTEEAATVLDDADALIGVPADGLASLRATAIMLGFLRGGSIDWDGLAEAVAAEDALDTIRGPATSRPRLVAMLLLHMAGRRADAASCCERLRSRLACDGDQASLAMVDFWLPWILGGLGELDRLAEALEDANERSLSIGGPGRAGAAHSATAALAAWRGDRERCIAAAADAIDALGVGSPQSVWPMTAVGLAHLGCGDLPAAFVAYEPLIGIATMMGLHQPAAAWWTPELIEVLAGLGRVEEARRLLDAYDVDPLGDHALDARAIKLRCAGLVAAADGDVAAAGALLRRAVDGHGPGGAVLERARTLLHLGALLRREGQRRAAEGVLVEALDVFAGAGAGGWAEQARSELGRLGRRRGDLHALTPAEASVADLVAAGLTNREVAARLYLSPKTVEAHLTRIYRKLGVRTRVGLVSHLHEAGPAVDR